MEIILASQSPRRRELLTQMGIKNFEIMVSDTDEIVDRALPPHQVVMALAEEKAAAVANLATHEDLILAADTLVALDGAVLGKPRDEENAREMLRQLSGRQHQVYTGVAVKLGDTTITEYEMTQVEFHHLTEEEITHYIATGEPRDKAGSYGIQGVGGLLVARITGDYFNVMGLPIQRVGRIFARLGIDCLALAANHV